MPRPGPRPYECVRRAWHSDRHHPIRGSLIQDIFRLVNEVHSSATKKNKEWQEKLPVVVLKAEEIMYSKANSEAEYMDIKTLWDRTNDAINTIIRRDESTETGELLQPCIEAALNLGCTPRRASRSQRNGNPPMCYLSPGEDPINTTPAMIPGSIQTNDPRNLQFIANYPNLINPTISNLIQLASEPQNLVPQKSHNVTSDKSPYVAYNNGNQFLCIENYPGSSLCCVYPLYYGGCPEKQHCFGTTTKSFLGELEPIKGGISENLLSCNVNVPADGQKDLRYDHLNQHEVSCDLSLRLGSLSTPFSSKENIQSHDSADGFSQERCKLNDQKQKVDKDVSFTNVNVDDPLHCPSKFKSTNKIDLTKKRKAFLNHPVENQPFFWPPKLPCSHLTGKMESAGS